MDELANRYFNSPEDFGKGMGLLMAYKEREKIASDWSVMEAFLMSLDEGEDFALDRALAYNTENSNESDKLNQENEFLRRTITLLHNKTPEQSTPAKSPLLSVLKELYLKERRANWNKKNYESNDGDLIPKLNLFIEIVGDRPATDITKECVSGYKTILFNYPANRTKKSAYKNLTISEISNLIIPDVDKLSNTTISNNFDKISTFLKWCESNSTGMIKDLNKPLIVNQRAKLTRVLGKTALKSFHPRLLNTRLFGGESWSVTHGYYCRNQTASFCQWRSH